MSYEINELDEIWRKGDGDMPDKLKYVVNAAQEKILLNSLRLSVDAENTIRYNAKKNNTSVNEYLSVLIMTSIQSAV
jgi:hypothetical protein